jgi:hypothetical protein
MRIFFLILFSLTSIKTFAQNLFDFVYDKERLEIIKDSMTVFGVISWIHGEVDGDYHLRLKMPRICDSLLSERNCSKQDSSLVLEIICGKGSVFTICNNYKNSIPLPKVGDFVRVVGAYVFDRRHRWHEIHPVYLIEKAR